MPPLIPKIAAEEATGYQPIRAPRGTAISCKGWQQEAALRMLMNNLDPEVAEKPEDLIVYGGRGKAARNWKCFHAIVASLRALENDETLLVQSGKPVGIFRTHTYAPRVLIANSNLVGHWNDWEHFDELDRAGLMMYGQMTAGSWIYIGTQGILQGTYETFAAAGRKHFQGDLAGKLIASGGMGGMGGAQPLAATLNGAAFLGIDVDPERIKRRVKTGYCDVMVNDLDEALRILKNAVRKREATSVGLVGNCADVIPELARRGVVPDLLTDQTSAHDPVGGYIPQGLDVAQAAELRKADPADVSQARARIDRQARRRHARAAKARLGHIRLRQQHPHLRLRAGREERLRLPRLRPRLHSSAILRRPRAVPLGRAFGRAVRHSSHRPARARNVSAQRNSLPLDSASRKSACAFRGCRRASAGSATASATNSASRSTISSRAAN